MRHLYFSTGMSTGGRDYRIGLYRPAMLKLLGQEELGESTGFYAILQIPGGLTAIMAAFDINQVTIDEERHREDGYSLIARGEISQLRSSGSKDAAGNKIKLPRGKNATTGSITIRADNFKYFRTKKFDRYTFESHHVQSTVQTRGITYRPNALYFQLPEEFGLSLKRAKPGNKPQQRSLFDDFPRKPESKSANEAISKVGESRSVLLASPDGDIFKEGLSPDQCRMIAAVINAVK